MSIHISSNYDSGNIEVVDASDPKNIQLKIRPDPYCEHDKIAHFMWYSYRLTGAKDQELVMKIVNAGQGSFPEAWPEYKSCASYDLKFWFRVPTEWNEKTGHLTITHKPEQDGIYYSYFAPYPYTRHQELVARMQACPGVRMEVVGQSLDRRNIDLLVVGVPGEGKHKVWLTCRQHPGEAMAEWFIEGFLERLVDRYDGLAARALKHAVFYIVPNINPDGSIRGHLRTNAVGANLNREWDHPAPERSPEVLCVLQKMDQIGVDLYIDVHGDEEFAFNFLAGEEGIPSFDDSMGQLQSSFVSAFARASPDFDTKPGYKVDDPGQAAMSIASNAIGERFKCLSFTLEMPFKDVSDLPDVLQGWSPERARRFGASFLHPIYEVLPSLRKQLDNERKQDGDKVASLPAGSKPQFNKMQSMSLRAT